MPRLAVLGGGEHWTADTGASLCWRAGLSTDCTHQRSVGLDVPRLAVLGGGEYWTTADTGASLGWRAGLSTDCTHQRSVGLDVPRLAVLGGGEYWTTADTGAGCLRLPHARCPHQAIACPSIHGLLGRHHCRARADSRGFAATVLQMLTVWLDSTCLRSHSNSFAMLHHITATTLSLAWETLIPLDKLQLVACVLSNNPNGARKLFAVTRPLDPTAAG